MELRQLRYFVKMVELGNMTKAAAELHVAQPSLSQQLANLEATLNIRLMERGLKGVVPTAAGGLFYRHAKKILRQVEDAKLAMQRELASPSGEVTIAMPSSTASMIVIPLIRQLHAENPGIRLRLHEVPSVDIAKLLSRGDVDIGIMPDVHPAQAFNRQFLLIEELFAVLPASIPWDRESISLQELAQFPFLLPHKGNSVRECVDRCCVQTGIQYNLAAEINVTNLLALAVRNGLGVSILPWSGVHSYEENGQVQIKPLAGSVLNRELQLCTPEGEGLTAATDVVARAIQIVCANLVQDRAWRGAERP